MFMPDALVAATFPIFFWLVTGSEYCWINLHVLHFVIVFARAVELTG